ncbi:hypothetical protein [Xanthomonas arboricola]|uniref:hypothetical protein n=1 Tax=Xanthomonas arboricola TaxID=56448 RepID=UPI001C0EBE87|nr:hypothetical protein [Xanthomonas arboricola]
MLRRLLLGLGSALAASTAIAVPALHGVIPGSELFVDNKEDEGNHFLMFKNPIKFTQDMSAVASRPQQPRAVATARNDDAKSYRRSGVELRDSTYLGAPAIELRMPASAYQDPAREQLSDRNFMAWLPVDFHDGTIEAEVASDLAEDAPAYARGFVGISFRIDAEGRFESVYLRPTNSTADDQERRNHSVQYAAYPEFRFDRLRREAPSRYEAYADLSLGRWIPMKLVVAGAQARLYLDGKSEPALVVNDLKLGPDQHGGVGIWIESGTVAHFRNLRVTP